MGFVLRNWPIKLAAVAIATILYTGIVFSGSFREETWNGPVDVETVGKPDNTYLFTDEPLAVEEVRYRVPATIVQRVTRESFQAVVDLADYDIARAGEPQRLSVSVTAADGIQVLDWAPRQVTVRLDQLSVRELDVVVDAGEVPPGFELGTAEVEPQTVEAHGPRTRLAEVVHAVAQVRIDDSGLDVRQQVRLVAVDANGEVVDPIDLNPALVTVDIPVRATETNKTVPVDWDVQGAVASGFVLEAVSAQPAVVTVRGDPRVLAELESIATQVISIEGLTSSAILPAVFVLPEGVTLLEETEVSLAVTVAPEQSSRVYTVTVLCQGEPEGGRCEPTTDQLTVTLAGPLLELNALDAAEVTPSVSVSGLGPGTHSVTPSFALPETIEVLGVSPAQVQVVVSAAPTPTPTPSPAPTATVAP